MKRFHFTEVTSRERTIFSQFGFSKVEAECIQSILECPTTSFHEHRVRDCVLSWVERFDLKAAEDEWGNVVVFRGLRRRNESIRSLLSRQDVILSAHMDHPGFEVVKSNPRSRQIRVRTLGGVHPGQLSGSRVQVWDELSLVPRRGKVLPTLRKLDRSDKQYRLAVQKGPKEFVVRLDSHSELLNSSRAFGFFDQPGCRLFSDGRLMTKAADNLINCALGLIALQRLKSNTKMAHVLTRAEEVGFVGLYGLLKSRSVPDDTPWIVLEASQAKPPVHLGGGVVVRVGDRASTFDSATEHWLHSVASRLGAQSKSFAFQRALLQGGTCEATLLNLFRKNIGALALPLANYHNVGPNRAEPEIVHLTDVRTMVTLLTSLNKPSLMNAWASFRRRLEHSIQPKLQRLRT